MKIFATGANGYIGKALVSAGVFPLISDVTDPVAIDMEIGEKKPDIILHLAAKSDPDFCEELDNQACVIETNVRGTYNVFTSAFANQIPCVLFSTGQIWKGGFWEGEHRENDKKTPPVNMYGMTKLGAEAVAEMLAGYIIRSSFVFDAKRLAPKIDALKRGEKLYEPTFIRRSFIYLEDFVSLVLRYCDKINSMPRVLHLAGDETVSWYDFMYEVARQQGLEQLVRPRRRELKILAPRPGNAGLNTYLARSLGFRIPNFTEGISRMVNNG